MDQAGFEAYQKEQDVSTGADGAQGNSQQQGGDGGVQTQAVLDALAGKGQQAQGNTTNGGDSAGDEKQEEQMGRPLISPAGARDGG